MANTHHLLGTGAHKVIALHGWFADRHGLAPMEGLLTGSEFTYAFMDYRGYGGMKKPLGEFHNERNRRRIRWRWPMRWGGANSA